MAYIRIASNNLIDASGANVGTSGYITPDALTPIAYLSDRATQKLYQGTVANTGVSYLYCRPTSGYCNAVIIPAGHGFAGQTVAASYKPSSPGARVELASVTAAAGVVIVEFGRLTDPWQMEAHFQYAGALALGELSFADVYTTTRLPSRQSSRWHTKPTVDILETYSGGDLALITGTDRRVREYHYPHMDTTMKDELLARIGGYRGRVPFWLCDHEGVWIFGRLTEDLAIEEVGYGQFSCDLKFTEVNS